MSGQTALVTGASRGIGRALCMELSRRGWRVFGGARSWPASDQAGFTPLRLDVTDPIQAKDAVDRIINAHGRLDLLVNNAGISHSGAVEETPPALARRIFTTNYEGVVVLVQAVLPHMRRQGGGVIANVGSVAGKIGLPFQAHYSASKFALEGLSESLWHEVRPFGIRVKLLEPGNVGTTIWSGTEHVLPAGSPYTAGTQRFLASKTREMGDQADSPGRVARQMADAVEDRSTRLRYPVAKGAPLFLAARKLLPDRLFLHLVRKHYHQIFALRSDDPGKS